MKVREIIKIVEADGLRHVKTPGSHRQYKHPTKPGRVTVPGIPATMWQLERGRAFMNELG